MEGFEDVYPVRQIQAMVSAELKSFAKQASECGLIIPCFLTEIACMKTMQAIFIFYLLLPKVENRFLRCLQILLSHDHDRVCRRDR